MAVGYVITDKDGRQIDTRRPKSRGWSPVMNGVPSPLQYTAGASLAPGDYTLKLAVAEGDRVGTVEHTLHASLADAGDVEAERADGRRTDRTRGELLTPTSATRSASARCTDIIEAYGPQLERSDDGVRDRGGRRRRRR